MELNETVLKLIGEYPTDGTHQYHWVAGFDGVTRDLEYQGNVIAKSEDQQRTYCCGLTFEVYFRACLEAGVNLGSLADVKRLKNEWFIARTKYPANQIWKHKGPADALVPQGLGIEVQLEQARPGDFLQLWRKNGSGHSVIFMESVENGFQYWSTQPVTDGIGKRVELFTGSNPVTHVHICRALIA